MPVVTDPTGPHVTGPAQRTELILSQIDQLPTLSAVAIRVLEATRSSDSDLQDIARLIASDPALTTRILSLVRRADRGVRGDNVTVARAVVLLGLDAVRSAVLAIKIFETFAGFEGAAGSAFDRTEFWKHSLAVACGARLMAAAIAKNERGRRVMPEEAFIAGLLHDLGKIALDACLPKSYARVVATAAARRACLCDAERETFGVDHTAVGRRLATRWRLPDYVPECCWLHHHPVDALPASIRSTDHVALVQAANQWARRQRIGHSGSNDVEPLGPAIERFGLSETQLDELGPALMAQVEEHCALIGLANVSSTQLYHRALAQANEELSRANLELASARQRDAGRDACVETLGAFTRRLCVRDDLVDVCGAVAHTLCELLNAPAAAAFALHAGSRLATVVWQADGQSGCDLVMLAESGDSTAVPAASGARLIPPPNWAVPIVEYLDGKLDAVWSGHRPAAGVVATSLLPIEHGGPCVGGVLIGVTNERASLAEYGSAMESLVAAFGLAIAAAADRADATRLHEDLATANRQLRQAQGQIIRSRSLSMIAEMAAGAAHELNNPLAVIAGRAQLLLLDMEDSKQRQALEIVNDQARRCSEIVTELMAFAKPTPPTPVSTRLNTLLDAIGRHWLASSSLTETNLSWRVADPQVTAFADPAQVTLALDALLANAVEATRPETARIHINSSSRGSDETVVVCVIDNGIGMAPQVLEHALDPFFSHRAAGRGRGLGLSKAHRLIEINGGRLWLESSPGAGTRAYVELPSRPT